MTTTDEHNAFVDMLAAMPPNEARRILAHALRVLHNGDLGTAETLRLAGIALQHLDEMRIRDDGELSRAEAAADDFFARLDGDQS